MKILIFFLSTLISLHSLSQCPEFDRLMQAADSLLKAEAYQDALNKLEAAREHCPEKSLLAGEKNQEVFDAIEGKRREAVQNAQRAQKATLEAQQATEDALAQALAFRAGALPRIMLPTSLRVLEHKIRQYNKQNRPPPPALPRTLAQQFYTQFAGKKFRSRQPLFLLNLNQHTDYVYSASFSPDGKFILTSSRDNTAKLWNLQGALIADLNQHTDPVSSASFSPDGKFILTSSWKTIPPNSGTYKEPS